MENQFQELTNNLKGQLPGSLATALFHIPDGLVLSISSDIPDTDVNAMSASHAVIWDKISTFLRLLPGEIVGDMRSMVLEIEGMNFFIAVDKGYQIAVMAASKTESCNLGLLRVVTKRYLNKALLTLSNL